MLEIPSHLAELFHKLLFDFDYFTYAMLNGGLFGLISVLLIIWFIKNLVQDSKAKE